MTTLSSQDLLVVLHSIAVVRVELLAQRGVFAEGNGIRRPRVPPRNPVVGPVDALAAHHHDPAGGPPEDVYRVLGLPLVHGDHVEHHLGREAPELTDEVPVVPPVTSDTPDSVGEARPRSPPVEHHDLVGGLD
jgi:hypothetical protein